jgi:hypothetical protein
MGRLVRSTTSNGLTGKHAVYWQDDNGSRHWVTGADEVNKRGGWNTVQVIPDTEVAKMPLGHSVGFGIGHRALVRPGTQPRLFQDHLNSVELRRCPVVAM